MASSDEELGPRHQSITDEIPHAPDQHIKGPDAFVYTKLDPSCREIRLLALALSDSNTDGDAIQCEIFSLSLDSAPAYEALSYTWGSIDDKQTITLSGAPFEITQNLYAALLELRSQPTNVDSDQQISAVSSYRLFWIDAICINQEDVEERSSQVQMMWSIYEKAAAVRVWLGEASDDSDLGMEMIRLLNMKFEQMEAKYSHTPSKEQHDNDSGEVEEASQKPKVEDTDEAENEGAAQGYQTADRVSKIDDGGKGKAQEDNMEEEMDGYDPEWFLKTTVMSLVITKIPQWIGGFWIEEVSDGEPVLDDHFYLLPGVELLPSSANRLLRYTRMSYISRDKDIPPGALRFREVSGEDLADVPQTLLLAEYNSSGHISPGHNSSGVLPHQPWVAFQKLMKRPWWRRIWVVQEIAAAKGAITIGCGSKWLPWSSFSGATTTINWYKNRKITRNVEAYAEGTSLISDKSRMKAHNDGQLDKWRGLLYLLLETQSYLASDPRDKVFAVLGFCPSIGFKPDYSLTVNEVYAQIVRLGIQISGALTVLHLNRYPKQRSLPSWMPDFSLSLTTDELNNTCPRGFFGSDGNNWQDSMVPSFCCTLRPEDTSGQLSVVGFKYDTPLVLGRTWNAPPRDRQSSFFDIINEYKELLEATDAARFPKLEGQTHRHEAFWRTLIWNADENNLYPAPDVYGEYFTWLQKKEAWIENYAYENLDEQRVIPHGEAGVYYTSFVTHGLRRRFFMTEKGLLGSGPREMQMGDQICILMGSKTPMVLREGAETGCYELVGHAYVHGIMHGEALKFLDERDSPDSGARSVWILNSFCLI